MRTARRLALLAGLALLPQAAFGQPEGRGGGGGGQGRGNQGQGNQGHGNQGQGNQGQGNRGGRHRDLGPSDHVTVRGWLQGNPGYAVQPLPPGMRNRLAQGKPLPPGIARRTAPPELIRLLPVQPGYEYVVIGASLVLVSVATGMVASILSDALLR